MQDSQNDATRVFKAEFDLFINPQEYLKYYQGRVSWVVAVSTKGLRIRFPANLLKPYVTNNGIKGRFVLEYLASGKLVSLNNLN